MANRRVLQIVTSLAGLVLFIFLLYRLGPENILSLFREMAWGIAGVVFIYSVQVLVRAAALSRCIPGDSRPAFRQLLQIRFIGEAIRGLTFTGPFLSEPATAWFMKKRGVKTAEAAAAAIAEYVAHSFASAALIILAVIYMREHMDAIRELRVAGLILLYAAAGYLVLAAVVLYRRLRFIGFTATALSRIPGLGRLGANPAGIRRTEEALLFVLRDRPIVLLQIMALEAAAHALLIFETYWAMISMGLNVSVLTAFVAEGMTKLVNVASFMGVIEGAYSVLFFALGLPTAAGFTLSLVKRVRSLSSGLIGIGTLAAFPNSSHKSS